MTPCSWMVRRQEVGSKARPEVARGACGVPRLGRPHGDHGDGVVSRRSVSVSGSACTSDGASSTSCDDVAISSGYASVCCASCGACRASAIAISSVTRRCPSSTSSDAACRKNLRHRLRRNLYDRVLTVSGRSHDARPDLTSQGQTPQVLLLDALLGALPQPRCSLGQSWASPEAPTGIKVVGYHMMSLVDITSTHSRFRHSRL